MEGDELRDRLAARGPDGYVLPDYDGYSFHRVVPTLLDVLGGDVPADRTLPDDALPDLPPGVDRVLLLFVDGFGDTLWRRHVDDPLVAAFEAAGRVTPLTTIYPSETAAAVTSHHTGLTAAEHGAIGWDQWIDSVGRVVQTLPFTAGEEPADVVGASVADLFDGDPLYSDAGIETTVVQPTGNVDTAYTRRATEGAGRRGYEGLEAFAGVVSDAVETASGPALVDAYLPQVDAVGHARGTRADAFHEEVSRVSEAIRTVLGGLDDQAAERTMVALTADHGLLNTDPETNVDLLELDGVAEHRREHGGEPIPPAGSGRNVHLFLRPAGVEKARTAIEQQVDCLTFTREEALSEGLFGPAVGDRIRRRCGDLVVVPREKTVWDDPAKLAYVGMHGGLSPAEMLVPLASARATDLRAGL